VAALSKRPFCCLWLKAALTMLAAIMLVSHIFAPTLVSSTCLTQSILSLRCTPTVQKSTVQPFAVFPENTNFTRRPRLTFCRPKLLQILSCVFCKLSPPPLSVRGGGKRGAGQQQQWVGVNRQHTGGENLAQFRTTESLPWVSCNTYSLSIPIAMLQNLAVVVGITPFL
jgi:hypothetical protein